MNKEISLVKSFLKEYADIVSNDCCNDWSFPDDWTQSEKERFVKQYHAWNGDPEEFNPNRLNLPNFAVASFLAFRIGNEKPSEYSIKVKNNREIKESWILNYMTKEQQEDFIKTSENNAAPYVVKFSGSSGIGESVKIFGKNNTFLADITDYDSW